VQAYGDGEEELGFVLDEKGRPTDTPLMVPQYVKEMQKINFNVEDYGANGSFTLKAAARIKNAKDPVAEASALIDLLFPHFTKDQAESYQGLSLFKKAYAAAKTDEEKAKAIDDFAYSFAKAESGQIRMNTFPATLFFSNKLEIPGGFAGVVMTTLFAGSDAAEAMLDDNFSDFEKAKIMGSMKLISIKELNAGWLAGAETIMNAIIDDTKKLGGDDSYQIDIGV
jgi:hypothetical protein